MINHPRLAYRELTAESRAVMLESRRIFRLRTLQETGRPFTGPYYWIPLPGNGGNPDDNWELIAFVDQYYGNQAEHIRIWKEIVAIIARRWKRNPDQLARNLNDSPYGLPRGRVTRMVDGHHVLFHGNDHPQETDLQVVLDTYNLPVNDTLICVDDHEHVIPEQVTLVRSILKADYTIAEPPGPFADDLDGT